MEVVNKYVNEIKTEINSSNQNMTRLIDLFKTTTELYSHTQQNLINTILYPESNLAVKYPSDWYRPTATFKLTFTFTVQPRNGKFLLAFYPNMLFEQSTGLSNFNIVLENLDGGDKMLTDIGSNERILKPKRSEKVLDKITDALGGGDFLDNLIEHGKSFVKEKVKSKFGDDFAALIDDASKHVTQAGKNAKQKSKQIIQHLKNKWEGSDSNVNYHESSNKVYIPDDIIEQYRCNAAVLSVKGENADGMLFGTTTYFKGDSFESLDEQLSKYTSNFNNFAQEWIYKLEENPEMGMRVIKTPKDNSDHAFRSPNKLNDCEHVILIAGKGLSNNILLVDVIQHIEFIPKNHMMDFFTPTIPMYSIGSKEQLNKVTSNFPIIGANGGLIINSPKKMEAIMNYLKKYKENSNYQLSLWNVLADSSYLTDPNLLNLINTTIN